MNIIKESLLITTILISINNFSTFAQSPFWQATNGPLGGTVLSFAATSKGHIIAGTENGIYRSTNEGLTWDYRGMPLFSAMSLAVNSHDEVFAVSLLYYQGIIKSLDSGKTWDSLAFGNTAVQFCTIAIDSNDNIFAGTLEHGILRSTDRGTTWQSANTGISGHPMIRAFIFDSSNRTFVSTSGGIYSSTDYGNTWSPQLGLNTFAMTISKSGNIFAGFIEETGWTWGVVRSTDLGINWEILTLPTHISDVYALTSSSDSSILVGVWGQGIWHSTNEGNTWRNFMVDTRPYYVTSLLNNKNKVWAGTFISGVRVSTDNGHKWKSSNKGMKAFPINQIICRPDGNIFTASGEIFGSPDKGATWNQISNLGDQNIYSIAINSKHHYFAGSWTGINRSTDFGNTWEHFVVDSYSRSVPFILIDTLDHIYTACDNGIFKSTDNAKTWTRLTSGTGVYYTKTLCINSKGFFFTGSTTEGMFRSVDQGERWERINTGLSTTTIFSLALNHYDHLFAGTNIGMFRSTDEGLTWQEINSGRIRTHVYSVVVSNNNTIYSGGIGGVFISMDNGNNWSGTNSGLPHNYVQSLALDSSDYLYVGLITDGVYRSKNKLTTINNDLSFLPITYSLSQNFPNPFNPVTSFQFKIADFGFVTLRIFNQLGQEVETVVSEKLHPGTYSRTWNAEGFPSGVYYYRLQTDGAVETKKLLLLR